MRIICHCHFIRKGVKSWACLPMGTSARRQGAEYMSAICLPESRRLWFHTSHQMNGNLTADKPIHCPVFYSFKPPLPNTADDSVFPKPLIQEDSPICDCYKIGLTYITKITNNKSLVQILIMDLITIIIDKCKIYQYRNVLFTYLIMTK